MSRNYRKSNGYDWLSDLKNNLDKSAVQPIKDSNLFQQINNIMNGGATSKFSTVDEVVEDMKARSGLTAHLSKQSDENDKDKKLSIANSFLSNYPDVINTIDNLVESAAGTLSVPAIIEKARNLHENDVNDDSFFDDDRLVAYVSHKNLKEKSDRFRPDNYSNLGKKDFSLDESDEPWNTNPWYGFDNS